LEVQLIIVKNYTVTVL